MRIIARSTLREFWEIHPDAEQPLKQFAIRNFPKRDMKRNSQLGFEMGI